MSLIIKLGIVSFLLVAIFLIIKLLKRTYFETSRLAIMFTALIILVVLTSLLQSVLLTRIVFLCYQVFVLLAIASNIFALRHITARDLKRLLHWDLTAYLLMEVITIIMIV